MYILKTKQSFDAAHFLFGYVGKCKNIHGHRWVIEAQIYSETVQNTGEKRGMVVDFGDLKRDLKEIADFFDHSLIIEKTSLKPVTLAVLRDENFKIIELDFRPTAENFAAYIFKKMEEKGYRVKRTVVYETPDNCAVFEK